MQAAALATRKPKDHEIGQGELLERWRDKAKEISLDGATIEETFDLNASHWYTGSREVLTEEALGRKVTESISHFDRRDAIRAVADSLREGATGAEVECLADEFLTSESVIQIAESRAGPVYTTERIWALEREALAALEQMKAEGPDPAGELAAARVISQRPTLKDDQRQLVERLLGSREGIVVVIGAAGTGKIYALVAAAEGWAQAGIEVQAVAPTWRAANVLAADGLPATTVASFLSRAERARREGEAGGLGEGLVLLVDEAGMVDSASLARLIDHAREAETKLVLVGDPAQLGEIDAGGLFGAVADRSEPIRLEEVIRHEHEVEREGARLIREGQGGEALHLYRAENRVTVARNAEERREAMVRDWIEALRNGQDAMMIAQRNAEVAKLNELAREVRRQEGQLGSQEVKVGEEMFAAGDRVITRVNDRQDHLDLQYLSDRFFERFRIVKPKMPQRPGYPARWPDQERGRAFQPFLLRQRSVGFNLRHEVFGKFPF
jgi:ATP-dependent exoDNAse (exonuclease V) alpha subunit